MNEEFADRNSGGAIVCTVVPSRSTTSIARSPNVTFAMDPASTRWRNSEKASGGAAGARRTRYIVMDPATTATAMAAVRKRKRGRRKRGEGTVHPFREVRRTGAARKTV